MDQTFSKELAKFLESSPSAFHAIDNMENILIREKFVRLCENQRWQISPGGRYFVDRNGSSLIAFTVPESGFKGLRIMASHSDSPAFKIKENPELETDGHYIRLNVVTLAHIRVNVNNHAVCPAYAVTSVSLI